MSNQPLQISEAAELAAADELEQHDDLQGKGQFPLGHFVQLAINTAKAEAYREAAALCDMTDGYGASSPSEIQQAILNLIPKE
jgi:hypothetical protein